MHVRTHSAGNHLMCCGFRLTSNEWEHEASTLSMQILASVCLHLHKYMHADMLTPHFLNEGKINAVPMEINYMSLSELG